MNKILEKKMMPNDVCYFKINAPRIARKHKAGQFVILRPTQDSERIPLTIANTSIAENQNNNNNDDGWIEIIFQAVGKTTMLLRDLNVGDCVHDLAGPLGQPTHIEKFGEGRVICIGGGVGAAPLYPITRALCDAGNNVTMIIGARSKSLVMLEEEFKSVSHKLLVATDDGSYGIKGFVTDVFNQLMSSGEKFDAAFVVGPAVMMRAASALTVAANIKTYVSLNPIMIDGTGMCGCCRVNVGGQTKFACVDGPEFDASLIDWDEMVKRAKSYVDFEAKAREDYHTCKIGGGQ